MHRRSSPIPATDGARRAPPVLPPTTTTAGISRSSLPSQHKADCCVERGQIVGVLLIGSSSLSLRHSCCTAASCLPPSLLCRIPQPAPPPFIALLRPTRSVGYCVANHDYGDGTRHPLLLRWYRDDGTDPWDRRHEARVRRRRREVVRAILCHPFRQCLRPPPSSSSSLRSSCLSSSRLRAACCGAIDGLLTSAGILSTFLGLEPGTSSLSPSSLRTVAIAAALSSLSLS